MTSLTLCRYSDCWCRAWPPERLVLSTHQLYTIEAAPYVGEPWLFWYVYREAAA